MSEPEFRIALIAIYSLFTIIRIRFSIQARLHSKTEVADRKEFNFLTLLIIYEVVTFFLYVFFPSWLEWGQWVFPGWVRWTGAGTAFVSLGLFIWVHLSLGNNFSALLRIREDQTLITSGAYRYVRHPMYTAFFILHAGVFLLSSSWFIGLTWNIGLILIMIERIPKEEAMLLSKFGVQYRAYKERTGFLLPNFITGLKNEKEEP